MEVETIKKSQKKDNTGDRKPRKEIRSHKCKHHQQNTRHSRISGAEGTIENINTSQRKHKKQKAPNPKHLGNPGHNEKTKPKDNRYRRE